ncbi:MAG: TrkH family potassium uptake protein [Planctomycetes bacterium]|nr:TrkH family potassium uptake protein [Planctomycetota bacterium]
MNYRLVAKQLGLLIAMLSGLMSLVGAWSFVQWKFFGAAAERHAWWALVAAALGGMLGGGLVWLRSRSAHAHLGRRESLLLVALSWLVGAVVAGVPYFIWAHLHFQGSDVAHPFHRVADCYFESMSGLTTTGATILSDIEALPRSLLLWRALTHWLGGLGIIVLFVAVLPSLGASGKRLFRVEAPGPSPGGVRPHIRDTAQTLLWIYLGLTAVAIVALRLTGKMDLFDSVCHTLSVLSTGGFSTRNASVAAFDSVAVDIIIIVLMLVAGVNFALFYQMTQGRFSAAWKDTELRAYLLLKFVVIALVFVNMQGQDITLTTGETVDASAGQALRQSAFTTVALHTGTGFCTADYDPWPFYSRVLLVGLMFIGGCAGSTAGGIKVIRLWIGLKVLMSELERAFRPNVVRPLRVGTSIVDPDMKLGAVVYVVVLFMLLVLGAVIVQLLEIGNERCDFQTAFSASMSTICNVGPGLHGVGARENYGWFGDASKMVMSLLMALGRLEIFAILVLFTPRFWRGN